jgi:hypothetical protein
MEQIYHVHNVVRSNRTKQLRSTSIGPQRKTQKLAGGAIIVRCGRYTALSESALKAHLCLIKQACKEGKLEVRMPNGQLIDLDTFNALPLSPTSPAPNPPLDSVANDTQNVGENFPLFPGGTGMAMDAKAPDVSVPEAPELEKQEEPSYDPVVTRRRSRNKKES